MSAYAMPVSFRRATFLDGRITRKPPRSRIVVLALRAADLRQVARIAPSACGFGSTSRPQSPTAAKQMRERLLLAA